jgi:hypothetical protein
MPERKSSGEERAVIVGQPSKRPYGAQPRVHVQTAEALGRLEESCVLLSTGTLLTATSRRKAPWEGGGNVHP